MHNGRLWRLHVRIPVLDAESEEHRELFAWIRDFVIPAYQHAPASVTMELTAVDPERPDDPEDPEAS
jgi:hypothetical protein